MKMQNRKKLHEDPNLMSSRRISTERYENGMPAYGLYGRSEIEVIHRIIPRIPKLHEQELLNVHMQGAVIGIIFGLDPEIILKIVS